MAPSNREVRRLLVRVKEECKDETKKQKEIPSAKDSPADNDQGRDSGVPNSQPGSSQASENEISPPDSSKRDGVLPGSQLVSSGNTEQASIGSNPLRSVASRTLPNSHTEPKSARIAYSGTTNSYPVTGTLVMGDPQGLYTDDAGNQDIQRPLTLQIALGQPGANGSAKPAQQQVNRQIPQEQVSKQQVARQQPVTARQQAQSLQRRSANTYNHDSVTRPTPAAKTVNKPTNSTNFLPVSSQNVSKHLASTNTHPMVSNPMAHRPLPKRPDEEIPSSRASPSGNSQGNPPEIASSSQPNASKPSQGPTQPPVMLRGKQHRDIGQPVVSHRLSFNMENSDEGSMENLAQSAPVPKPVALRAVVPRQASPLVSQHQQHQETDPQHVRTVLAQPAVLHATSPPHPEPVNANRQPPPQPVTCQGSSGSLQQQNLSSGPEFPRPSAQTLFIGPTAL